MSAAPPAGAAPVMVEPLRRRPAGGIRAAVEEAEAACRRADAERGEESRRRHSIRGIDEALSLLEEGLAGGHAHATARRRAVRIAEAATGRAAPQPVLAARSAVELHERLLEWEDEFLARPTRYFGDPAPEASPVHAIGSDGVVGYVWSLDAGEAPPQAARGREGSGSARTPALRGQRT